MPDQQPQAPLAQARPTVYIDVIVGGQRMSFDVDTAKQLVTEVTAALKSLAPPAKPTARRKKTAKKRSRKKSESPIPDDRAPRAVGGVSPVAFAASVPVA